MVEYLERADPEAARRAKSRYACFDRFGADTMACESGLLGGQLAVGHGGSSSSLHAWLRWLCLQAGWHTLVSGEAAHVPRLDTNFPAPSYPATHSLSLDAYAVGVGGASSCADAAVSILKEVVRNASEYG